MVHGYSFSEDSWGHNVSSSQLLNLSALLESNETGTVIGIDMEQILAGAEHDYIFIEWILKKGGTEFTSGIIGECLTKSGIIAIEGVIENAKFTMGQSGNAIERLTNTVKFSVAVNGIIPISLFLAAISITILFVFMTVFYKGNRPRNPSSERGKARTFHCLSTYRRRDRSRKLKNLKSRHPPFGPPHGSSASFSHHFYYSLGQSTY